jgi:hypothetical protein
MLPLPLLMALKIVLFVVLVPIRKRVLLPLVEAEIPAVVA